MAGLATQEFAAILKTRYLDPINDQVVRKHVLLNRIEKNSEDVSGNFAYIPLLTGRNPAVGSRKDTSGSGPKLPEAGRQVYNKATYPMCLHYGRGKISGAVKRKSRDNPGAFAKAMDMEMKGLMKSLPDDLNRQACGMGNGRAATIAADISTAAHATVLCDSRDPFPVRVGDRVTIGAMAGGTHVFPASGPCTVSSISLDSAANQHTVVLDTDVGTTGIASNAHAIYFGSATTPDTEDISRGQEMYGIQALIDDGNIGADMQRVVTDDEVFVREGTTDTAAHTKIGGIVRSTNAFWQSQVKANSGTLRPLTNSLFPAAWLLATAQNGALPSDVEIYMNVSMWGTLGMLQVGGRVFNDFKKKVEFGFEAIDVHGSMAFADRDLPRNVMFFLNMEAIMLLTQGGYEMLDDDGNVLRIAAGGSRDAWEFAVGRDCQVAINNARSHVKLSDLKSEMTVETTVH